MFSPSGNIHALSLSMTALALILAALACINDAAAMRNVMPVSPKLSQKPHLV